MDISPIALTIDSIPQLAETRFSRTTADHRSTSSSSSEEETAELDKLRARDREVRTHEQAHAAAAGGHAKGGPNFTFQRGSDGRLYAVGGEVNIDTSPIEGNPQATIRKAQQIRSAALAPADPSPQDRSVAASASALEAQARRELREEKEEKEQDQQTHDPANLTRLRIDLFV
ncbi:MAG: hypothetical protein MRJ96_04885 [Nitrospirales bacterium]|nr:hypothetical protein [Nitrospira sp.]MDR4500775.1 hypothetical protein [Nitrospirales bacterium]